MTRPTIIDVEERFSIEFEGRVLRSVNGLIEFPSDLDRSALYRLRVQTEGELNAIKAQLDAAAVLERTTGQIADRRWWTKAVNARRFKAGHLQQIQARMRELRLQGAQASTRKNNQRSYEGHFIRVAKEKLTGAMYFEICEEARRRKEEDNL